MGDSDKIQIREGSNASHHESILNIPEASSYSYMRNKIIFYLTRQRIELITLLEITEILPNGFSYDHFSSTIIDLCNTGILNPSVCLIKQADYSFIQEVYRVNRRLLAQKHVKYFPHSPRTIHPGISTAFMKEMTEHQVQNCMPAVKRISNFLHKHGFPNEDATSSERSYQIMGDEKWIDEKGGRKLLNDMRILNKMRIIRVPDPLMMAINPAVLGNDTHLHLVVENKSTYISLFPVLARTKFTSLIFGAGCKILSNLHVLEDQLGLPSAHHTIYYFGDLDCCGVKSWFALQQEKPVLPAIPFYRAMLSHPLPRGKKNQEVNEYALEAFFEHFLVDEVRYMRRILKSYNYYPQEVLSSRELANIWINGNW